MPATDGKHNGLRERAGNAAEKLSGKGKEAAGEAPTEGSLKAEGKADQAKSDLKQAAGRIKNAFRKT